jgi:Spy/CpxP family protein refolding chaperone
MTDKEFAMKRTWIAIAAAAVLTASAAAQPGPGYGPGMMGGYGSGMMMDGDGPELMGGGYGHGMMAGYGRWSDGYAPSDLSAAQRKALAQVRQDFWQKQWPLIQQMHAAMSNADPGEPGAAFDEQATRKAYDAVTGVRKQMFENMLEMRKQSDAVLTPKQREELRRGPGR